MPYTGLLAPLGCIFPPVAASTMRRITVIKPNRRIAAVKTVLVGHFLINGAIRMAPTHWAAWFTPWAAPTVVGRQAG